MSLGLKLSAFVVVEYNLIADGIQAFKRGELPSSDWPQAKLDGWNVAGMAANSRAMVDGQGYPEHWREGWVGE